MFRSRVIAGAGEAAEPRDRRDIDDVTTFLLAHDRQHGARHGEKAEHIGLELRPDCLGLTFFDRREIAIAGVVHEHVDASEPLHGSRDTGVDLVIVDDIQ